MDENSSEIIAKMAVLDNYDRSAADALVFNAFEIAMWLNARLVFIRFLIDREDGFR